MSGKASPRQERFARHRDDMVYGERVDLTVGKYPTEDIPIATVRIEVLPEFDFLVPVIKEALREANKDIRIKAGKDS